MNPSLELKLACLKAKRDNKHPIHNHRFIYVALVSHCCHEVLIRILIILTTSYTFHPLIIRKHNIIVNHTVDLKTKTLKTTSGRKIS